MNTFFGLVSTGIAAIWRATASNVSGQVC